jgi:hypothetical protein
MAIDRNDADERQARLDAMTEEFRAARQQRLVKQGIALWRCAETAQAMALPGPPPEKLH